MRFKLMLVALFLPLMAAQAQVSPSVSGSRTILTVGGGFSDFNPDFGKNWVYGATVWSDWTILHGLGIEGEARTLPWNGVKFPPYPTQLRLDSIEGGPRYQFRRYRNFQPEVKVLFGLGSIDFPTHSAGPIHHNTYGMAEVGGGVDYRLTRRISLRGEYDYERWPNFASNGLTPDGFTVGASYRIW